MIRGNLFGSLHSPIPPFILVTPQQQYGLGDFSHRALAVARRSGCTHGLSFQMNAASLPHAKLMRAIEAIGTQVVPALRQRFADESKLSERAVS
jgi:hypothetical protein